MSHLDEVQQLLRRSREFLDTARYQVASGICGLAAFSLEQALQLFLKAHLLKNGVDYPRSHGVRTLLETLADITEEGRKKVMIECLREYLLELGMLEDAYISARYLPREFRKEEVERLTIAVEEVMRSVS